MSENTWACGCKTAETRGHGACERCETHCTCSGRPEGEQELGEYNGMAD